MSTAYRIATGNQEETAFLQVLVIESDTSLLEPLVGRIGNVTGIELDTVRNVMECRERLVDAREANTCNDTTFDVVLFSSYGLSDQEVRQEVALLSEAISESDIAPKIVVVTFPVTFPKSGSHADLVENGAISGTVPAIYGAEQLLSCLRLVSSGVRFIPVESRILESPSPVQPSAPLSKELVEKLTPRQLEVLEYVSLGKSNKHIATELSLCESTVKVHVHEVMKRLGATSRTHATYIVNTQYRADSTESESSTMTAWESAR